MAAGMIGIASLIFIIVVSLVTVNSVKESPMTYSNDVIKFQIPLKGNMEVMQQVESSVLENYVLYYIEEAPLQRSWVLDDFNTDHQVIKSEEYGRVICYVSQLNRSDAMAPGVLQYTFIPYKDHSHHGVYTPADAPTSDRSFLSPMARQLCIHVDIYWLHPMEDIIDLTADIHGNASELTLLQQTNTLRSRGASRRIKRNIKSCETSCCWLVCCCNTRHFTWESSERFSCKHVCEKCTKAYKQKIQKIC